MKRYPGKILVTGGAGFIGSHLCERLIQERENIICLDNFNDYYDPRLKKDNISRLKNNSKFLLIRGDILDRVLLEKVFQQNKISKIIHLAALAGVRASFLAPEKYIDVDIKGTVNLLEMARDYEVSQFIFGSSSSVYGLESKLPFREDEKNLFPISPYSVSKLSGELYCRSFNKNYKIPMIILRFFTVFGPRQRPEMAIHKFTRLMKWGKLVPRYGLGNSLRDYTYIDDIIDGIMKALNLNKKIKFEIFNFGNSKTTKLKDMISTLEKKLDIKSKIKKLPDQLGDLPITYANISKAKKLLDWTPKISFEEGVERFLAWYLKKEKFLNTLTY